jgi:hypothetical protein
MSYLSKAIKYLKPTAEFSFTDDDYASIKWDVLAGDAPTEAEIDDAIKKVKADELSQAKAKATQKAALLDRLGITEDEAQLLLS